MKNTQHTIAQCNQKLVSLLEKLNAIDTRNTQHLPMQVDDAKALAQEISRETDYLNRAK